MIGEVISHYRIIARLGEGGMGVVYLAEDMVLGRQVAIKTLTDCVEPGRQYFRTRFLREARAVSALSHPHIATLHDYGETPSGQPYIVMEFIRGETLSEVMRKETLTISRTLEIIKEVAEALGEAHAHGIVHRDIKPSNIAINHRGEVKVLDFGLAKQVEIDSQNGGDPERETLLNTQTKEGMILGTPMYLSPEQALGVEVDARSDLFSLGAVLYECIAGKPPFYGSSHMDICAKVIRDDPAPPSQFNSDVSAELDRIAMKSLAKRREDRYQSAAELIEELGNAQIDSGRYHQAVTRAIPTASGTHSTGALATLSDIFKRPRLSIGYVAAGAIIVLLVTAAFWYAVRPRPHQPNPEALKWFEVGTNYLREGTYFNAIKPLERAVAIDSEFALAHARLAEVWSELDYTDFAQRELLRVDGLVPDRTVLPQLDALYLDGVRATITRDLSGAIQAYEAITRLKPNDAQAYVDLGRAFEKNEQIDAAIEAYTTASRKDPQHAAASLHLGVLYGRNRNLPAAKSAFDNADTLFQTLGNSEGRAEVLYQRGALSRDTSQLTAAQEQLEKALDIARTTDNPHQKIRAMLKLSSVLYLRGTTEPAQKTAAEAVSLAQKHGIEYLSAHGLIDLGNTYLFRREYGAAEQVLHQALDIARRNAGRRSEATALLALANLYIQQEIRTDEALENLNHALTFFERGGYSKELAQTLMFRGRAKLLKGDYDGALADLEQSLPLSTQVNDRLQIANTNVLIGNVLRDRELFPQALDHFEKSYYLYKDLGIPISAGYMLLDRSSMYWRLGKDDEAQKCLDELPKVAEQIDSRYRQVLFARSALVRSEIAASKEQFKLARSAAEQSIDLAGKQINHTGLEAKCVLALVLLRSGAKQDSLRVSQEVLEDINHISDQRLLSKAMLVQAEALLENNDANQALSVALQSQQRFAQSGQHESAWQALLLAARANLKIGNSNDALTQLQQAKQLLSGLEQKWGSENFKLYSDRIDIRNRISQLNSLFGS